MHTLESLVKILNACNTCSSFTFPPTSRKLAGSPPCNLTMSIVAIAKPAPLTEKDFRRHKRVYYNVCGGQGGLICDCLNMSCHFPHGNSGIRCPRKCLGQLNRCMGQLYKSPKGISSTAKLCVLEIYKCLIYMDKHDKQ
jgi:hypothetical protein